MFEITKDTTNSYAWVRSREQWIDLAGDWRDTLEPPIIRDFDGYTIWDDSHTGVGTKGRWGDLMVSRMESDHLVYVQPRVGWAGVSLSALAKKYDKKLTLFMPAAKQVSLHQLVCIERGAHPKFVRIAAMPVLNKIAREWAEDNDAQFVPFGLNHDLVVAAGIVSTLQHWGDREQPKHVASVISTGVLSRTLQLAFDQSEFHGVAVARNLHDGEIGRANVVSYHRPFLRDAERADDLSSLIDSARNYDMKGIEYLVDGKLSAPRDASTLVWNVAGEIRPEFMQPGEIDSQREWGEMR